MYHRRKGLSHPSCDTAQPSPESVLLFQLGFWNFLDNNILLSYIIIKRRNIMYDIIFYRDKNGKEPVKEYILYLKRTIKIIE